MYFSKATTETAADPLSASRSPKISLTNTESSSILLSRTLVALAFIAQIIVAWRFWAITWDDSAITLGFARTFALTGRIEPTPGSGIVEGYSTTLWMLLMAAAAKFATSPDAILEVAKISTLLLNLVNIILMRRWFLTWTSETLANLIAGSVGCGLMFYETINGMETPLLLTLLLVMLLLLPMRSRSTRFCYLLTGSAFLLVRWEAAWLLVPFILIERPIRRAFITSTTWLTVFVLSNLIRWQYFGSLLPNTIIAKTGVPYSNPLLNLSQQLQLHLQEPAYILASCKIMFIVLVACLLYDHYVLKQHSALLKRFRQSLHDSWQLRFALLFTLFSLVLSTAIGPNLGPPARSFYCGWPFLFCLLLLPVTSIPRPRVLPWATAVLCLFAILRMSVRVHELTDNDAPIYMPGATVAKVAIMSNVLSDIESASNHPNLVFAGPDMGGVLLYSNGVRVIDLGLLCDPVLAHQGYKAINSYVLQERQPDVIEVHQRWTKLSNFQALPLFRSDYRPVYVEGIRVFLTRKLITDIDPSRLTERSFSSAGRANDNDLSHRDYIQYEASDYILNREFSSYLVLK